VNPNSLPGWERLRHGGLLLDTQRLQSVAQHRPAPLAPHHAQELRRAAAATLAGDGDAIAFVTFVLEKVCGFGASTGSWLRGPNVGSEWSRRALTGESVKPRQLWRGERGAVLPVFFDAERQIGVGCGRRAASQVVQWLRAGNERLALLTNGRQWRLVFSGLDFDAWCEWDVDLWFEEGELSSQVEALRTLASPALWTPTVADQPAPLLGAVLDSRKGQAELSAALGERVREAVEMLVQAHGDALRETCADVAPADIYRAAVRVVMRLVVVLFAESRELLPRGNALYHSAYGVGGLIEELEKAAARGGNRLARSWSAWPRLLALFRLVHQGSHHPALPVPAYGGELFAPADPQAVDGLSKALAVFETAVLAREVFSDREVHRMLERVTRTRVKLRQGRASTWMTAPVDFSDLSSEYIGILYEGLLDFELKTAPGGDPVVFLAVGEQPALPLSRLEAMDDQALASLLEKLKDTSSKGDGEQEAGESIEGGEEEGDEETSDDEGGGDVSLETEVDAAFHEGDEAPDTVDSADHRHLTRTRAEVWARRAVEVGRLTPRLRGNLTAEKRRAYEDAVSRKARQLVVRVVLPGEWYLVRWGGTRKGSGTFYTRPGLAVPTVQRTLRPLAYVPPAREDGTPNADAPAHEWAPKVPEEILALKVCDPACGSGTFPVAALRYLTEALYASVHHHSRVVDRGDRSVVSLLAPRRGGGDEAEALGRELVPCRPDDASFEPRLKAVLRRYVVERCIYGVDLDPLAVELCRLALWVETMDRQLPFSFLDHKVKCGNSLIGAWFDQFQHYPVMAWKNRDGGDKGHGNGVHFEKEVRTKTLKAFARDRLTPDLRHFLLGRTLFDEDLQEQAAEVHAGALATIVRLHDLPVHDSAERARRYREEVGGAPAYQALKSAMDLWCACWLWPADELEHAPLPTTLAAPSPSTRETVERLARRWRFFHWELEFPDVFRAAGSGFDAMLGNPPWDIAKPNSKEFFSNLDPLYRAYGKQEALRYQSSYFADETLERGWLDYNADFRAQSNFVAYSASPFGDPIENEKSQDRFTIARGGENDAIHSRWRVARSKGRGFADGAHPFRHQGSADLNLYKTFLEQAHCLLREGGRLGFIVPSGLYSDHGTGGLRRLFLDRCQWEWLFNFINWAKIFPSIYYRFKFNAIVLEKGGETEALNTAFVRTQLEDWEKAESLATTYSRSQVDRFSPHSRSILEIQSRRDLDILEKIYATSVLLGDDSSDGWGIRYTTEFHMTSDSKLFPPRPKWDADGYRPDEYSRWLKGNWRPIGELWSELGITPIDREERRCAQSPYDAIPVPRADIPAGIVLAAAADAWLREDEVEDVALPLYEGRMIGQFDFSQKGWESGRGRSAKWPELPFDAKRVMPQFCMSHIDYAGATDRNGIPKSRRGYKLAFMDVASATNERTMVCTVVRDMPCGNSVPVLTSLMAPWRLVGVLNSLGYDYVARRRCSGLHLNYFVIEDSPIALPDAVPPRLATLALRLGGTASMFADAWLSAANGGANKCKFRGDWAVTPHERARVRAMVDAVGSALLGLTYADMKDILADCDRPVDAIDERVLPPNGFWRVDKDKEPELRHTVLTLVAFHDLEGKIHSCGGSRARGIEEFLDQNDRVGWMLPDALRLADYGLGHDQRAMQQQPVTSRFGPRFFDWQLAQSTEESWRECHLHARNLLGESGYRQLLLDIEDGRHREQPLGGVRVAEPDAVYTPQGTLFD